MRDIAIRFQNISKQYRLGTIGTGTLSHDLNRWWAKARGKGDPYLKIGEENIRHTKTAGDYIWALKNINLEVKKGEVLGIIGKNGAGKSTLLKLLSQITSPSTGKIFANGRIASLLEVGTGFHPEMTGRENVYLNGAIMGMTKAEIRLKFDEIVAFAGVENYIDTPVKRYSSGMIVRLGFAVAAHLEPEILVVDEVLAVGDAEFQKKAIQKMENVSKNSGRTVLFVSHNMGAVRNLCNKGIVLQNGLKVFEDDIQEAVEFYLADIKMQKTKKVLVTDAHRKITCAKDLEVLTIEMLNETEIATNEAINLKIRVKINNKYIKEARITGMLNANSGTRVGLFFSEHFSLPPSKDYFTAFVSLNNHNLAKGLYYFDFNIGTGDPATGLTDFDLVYNTVSFEVVYNDTRTKKLISKWASNWGYNNFQNVGLEVFADED